MIKKMKVMTVVGTRPELIRLSLIIKKLDEFCEHILVHTGQNYDYELNEVFFKDLDIRKPDYFLSASGGSSSETIGNIIIAVDKVLDKEMPDSLLVLGDTNSGMAILPAKRKKIPTFHMEAGNRCFDQRVPEEINRRILDHISDVNLTYSSIAREYLLREGLPADLIIKTGSPMFEVLEHYKEGIEASNVLERLELKKKGFFIVSIHREENVDSEKSFKKIVSMLDSVADTYNLPVIVSTHPRTQNRINSLGISFHPLVKLLSPMGFKDYNKLQISAKAVLSDSGTINEESSILNFPALNLRESYERPEGMEEGAVMMVGLSTERLLQALAVLEKQPRGSARILRLVDDYSMPNVSDKIIRILYSYTDYVNRVVWKKY